MEKGDAHKYSLKRTGRGRKEAKNKGRGEKAVGREKKRKGRSLGLCSGFNSKILICFCVRVFCVGSIARKSLCALPENLQLHIMATKMQSPQEL